MNHLELLALEIETRWSIGANDRIVRERQPDGAQAPYLVIGCATDGYTIAIGDEVPDAVAGELRTMVEAQPPSDDPAIAPAAMSKCSELLADALGPVEISSGPSYVIPEGTQFESQVTIHRSTDESSYLRERIPEELGWTVEEWSDLLDGKFGPWAMARVDDRVASICHSARLTDRGAEAGTWTHAGFRGRGYAATTTAAWASLLGSSGRVLFYSTSAGNVSSQRVAARLELPMIGWLWKVVGPSS